MKVDPVGAAFPLPSRPKSKPIRWCEVCGRRHAEEDCPHCAKADKFRQTFRFTSGKKELS